MHFGSCEENGWRLSESGSRKTSNEAFVPNQGRVDGGLNEWQLHRWLDIVTCEMYLNIERVTFPDGLNVSCKNKRSGEWA